MRSVRFKDFAITWQILLYSLVSVLLLSSSLTRVVHAESSAIVATSGFFIAGLASLRAFKTQAQLLHVLIVSLLVALVPLAVLTVAMVFIPGCGCAAYGQGVMIYALFVFPSILLAVSYGRYLFSQVSRRRVLWFIAGGLFAATIPALLTVKFFPQFYVYNHIFGGVLGPIYDEELAVRSGFYAFRFLTVLWAVLLLLLAQSRKAGAVAAGLLIVLVYAFSGRLGFRGSSGQLARSLGDTFDTEHFTVHYTTDSSDVDEHVIGTYLEYQYQRMAALLTSEPTDRVRVYLYPDASTKAKLTGAGNTSIAPVWLMAPQIHMLMSELGRSFDHELAHVFSREFGNRIVHASTRVGLVEGFAVAMETPSGLPDIDSQLRVLMTDSSGQNLLTAARMSHLVDSPAFWLDRGAIAYTASGSFVRWLIRTRAPGKFENVYRGSSFEEEYGESLDILVEEWKEYILSLAYDEEAASIGSARFALPSLFEKNCPHFIPRYKRLYRSGNELAKNGDQMGALSSYRGALDEQPGYQPAMIAALNVARSLDPVHEVDNIVFPADSLSSASLLLARGDYALARGQSLEALSLYTRVGNGIPEYAALTHRLIAYRKSVATEVPGSIRIFGVEEIAPVVEDSIRAHVHILRAMLNQDRGRGRMIAELEKSQRLASQSDMDFISGQLSVLYFWDGKFELGKESADAASRSYEEAGEVALAAYYRYVADLNRWAATNPNIRIDGISNNDQ